MNKITFFILSSFFCFTSLFAQELNCTIQVLAPQVTGTDKKVFETLQSSIYEFMNNRKWTSDIYLNQERIECSMQINISDRLSNDEYKATIQVQSRRPIFKTSYNSPLLNFIDVDFYFRYLEFQTMEFNEQTHVSSLTSVLAYYAYLIIGLDYDSFSPEGGTPYLQKAQTIVNNAQNAGPLEKGWKAFEGSKNRYWLVENLLNQTFKPMRSAFFSYHRNGFDIMTENMDGGRKQIMESLEGLKKVHQQKPGSFLMQTFFNAKSDEIVHVFSQAFPDEKTKMINLLNEIDPANSGKYQDIMKNE